MARRIGKIVALVLATLLAGFAIGLSLRLQNGPIDLSFLRTRIEDSLSALNPDVVARVGAVDLAWSGRGPEMRVRELKLSRPDGTVVALLPWLGIHMSLQALLHGEVAIGWIRLGGARLTLVRNEDGEIATAPDTATTESGDGAGLLAALASGSRQGRAGYLSYVRLVRARIVLDDRAFGGTWIADDARLELRLLETRLVVAIETRLTWESKTSSLARQIALPLSVRAEISRPPDGPLGDALIEATGRGGKGLLVGNPRDAVPIRSLALRATFSPSGKTLDVSGLEVTAASARLAATGRWSMESGDFEARADLGSLPVDELARLWPPGLASETREWIARNLHDGKVTECRFATKIPGHRPVGAPLAADALELRLRVQGVTVDYLRPIEPLRGVGGTLTLTPQRFVAEVDAGNSGPLVVHRGRMEAELRGRGVPATVSVDASGPTSAVFALLGSPPLEVPQKAGLDLGDAEGSSDVHVEIRFGLSPAYKNDVQVTASGDLHDARIPRLVYGVGIDGGQLKVRVDDKQVEIEGDTALTGAAPLPGPFHVALRYAPTAAGSSHVQVKFSGTEARGDASLDLDGDTLRTLTIPRLQYGRSDVSVRIARDAAARYRATLAGERLDVQPFLERMRSQLPIGTAGEGTPWELEAHVHRVLGTGGTEFTDVGARAQGAGSDVHMLDATGDLSGGGEVHVALTPHDGIRHFEATAKPGGQTLQALGLYEHASGGDLKVTATVDPRDSGTVKGHAFMNDFRVTNAPVLTRVLSVGSLDGIAGMLGGEGIWFSKARMRFNWSGGKLEVQHARAVGAIGITADGTIDPQRRRIDLHGSVIPAYTLNTALGWLPLFGKYLVGGEGQGLFGIEYRVGGTPDAPEVNVNALSALAPGILRKMFVDPFTKPAEEEPEAEETPAPGG